MKLQHTTHSLQRNHGAGRLLRAESADGDVMQQEYDVMGWITAARNNSALLTFTYFPTGDLLQTETFTVSTLPFMATPYVKLSFTYDQAGNRASVSEDFGAAATKITPITTTYTYDPAGRISTISDNTLTTFNYDGHGRRGQMRRSYLNLDHVTRYEYNDRGLLHSIAHQGMRSSAYQRYQKLEFIILPRNLLGFCIPQLT